MKAQIKVIDQEYQRHKGVVDAELNQVMDMEDRRSKGLIGETYTKLAEIMESKERAEACVGQTHAYNE